MAPRKGERPWDNWSWVHLAAGVGLGAIGLDAVWAAIAIVGFEAVEAGLRRIKTAKHAGGLFEYESWPNILADIIVGYAGWAAGALVLLWLGWDGWLSGLPGLW